MKKAPLARGAEGEVKTQQTTSSLPPHGDQPCTWVGQDRAAAVTTAVLAIIRHALIDWLDRGNADFASARGAVEQLLRDEFSDIARTTLNEIRREDG
jgi:hypothetical protein